MAGTDEQNPSEILQRAAEGDAAAADELLPLAYSELRRVARARFGAENADHTLQPTALVHEAYIKLVDQSRVDWQGRTHFLAIAAQEMRRILVDHAREREAQKRGGGARRVLLDDLFVLGQGEEVDALDLEDALRGLAEFDERQARGVELRFFAGLTVEERFERLMELGRFAEELRRAGRAVRKTK